MKTAIENLCQRLHHLASFVEALGERATTWEQVVEKTSEGKDVYIGKLLTLTEDTTISEGTLNFTRGGGIDLNGFKLIINVPIKNPRNQQIFFNVVTMINYPDRWYDQKSSLRGTFGDEPERDPRWWGLTSTYNIYTVDHETAEKNSHAIDCAVLSQAIFNRQVFVKLPAGDICIARTVRIDGSRCTLAGAYAGGMNISRLWGMGSDWCIDTSYYLLSEDYPSEGGSPTEGHTPMVEIGYHVDHAGGWTHPDGGFMSRVHNLTCICPPPDPYASERLTNWDPGRIPTRRISGVAWSGGGLQEGSEVSNVNVQLYSGYGVGGNRFQTVNHNGDPQHYYMQLNTILLRHLWIFSAADAESIGMSVYGINYTVDTVTVDHGGQHVGTMNRAAIYAGARACGRWQNIHIEQAPAHGSEGIGIHVPNIAVSPERLHFDSVHMYPFMEGEGTQTTCIKIETTRGSVTCNNIMNAAGWYYLGGARAIKDSITGRESSGTHHNEYSSDCVGLYVRSMSFGRVYVTTNDITLHPRNMLGELLYDPPTLEAGEDVDVEVSVPGVKEDWEVLRTSIQSAAGLGPNRIYVTGTVTADDVVTVNIKNIDTDAHDVEEGMLRVVTGPPYINAYRVS